MRGNISCIVLLLLSAIVSALLGVQKHSRGGGDTLYNGLYGEAPPERGTFFRLQVQDMKG